MVFYLAMEEYVARKMDIDDAFFMWQTNPTVIFGRNQLIDNEVNTDYCREHNIGMFRRKSGGGCVYSDTGNVMFSYVTKDENVRLTFNRYINMVALTLCRLGVEAKATGRNDILIDGKKVSGNAFYHVPGRSIVHGTMLYDTNMQHMVNSITPSGDKLQSKGVESVRQRIALLKDYINMGIDEFMLFVRSNLCSDTVCLDDKAMSQIEQMTQEYLSPQFIYGKNPGYTLTRRSHIEGAGSFEVRIELKNNVIRDVNILGDYFIVGDIGAMLKRLRNVNYDRQHIEEALPEDTSQYVLNMNKSQMTKLLID